MFLKRIEINGFKSFAKKTVLDFSSAGVFNEGKNIGITAIVGPNGSGKSNVADALRWALGEQSLKNIRGKKSQDVIFSGSGKKAKLGSAQVSIFIDNKNKKIPIDYEEIVITRKIYRSGEAEYLINGSKARLIDVIDLLAKIGIGQRSYCIVNQGMADQILNSSPLERRSIIEEAAGVKEFQVKKERSERKLRNTKNNLERVKSLLKEIEPHLRMLERQTKKAQKGQQYKEELNEKQRKLFGFLWHHLLEEEEQHKESQGVFSREIAMIQREIDDAREKLNKDAKDNSDISEKIHKLEEKEREHNNESNNLEREIIIGEGRLALVEERLENFEITQIIPVGIQFIQDKLEFIQKKYEELIGELEKVKSIEELTAIKKQCWQIRDQIRELLGGVKEGKIEKKKPNELLKKQRLEREIEIKKIKDEIDLFKKQKSGEAIQIEKIKEEIKDLIEKDKDDRRESIKLEDLIRRKQFESEKIREKYNDVKMEAVRIQVKKEELAQRIKREFQANLSELKSIKEKIDVNELEREIFRLKDKIEQVGLIDESIIEEYEETQKRFVFLEKESKDLEEAIRSLQRVIKQLEFKIKDEFEETFNKISKKFKEYFGIIFNGGKAEINKVEIISRMRKTKNEEGEEIATEDGFNEEKLDEEDEQKKEIGIEIKAVPPGKKIASLGMLSGGERTLTSLALLFAIISHNPPPFTFLDEVEAALDEANSKRFGRILNQLSGRTQFILITHNRQTMREAVVLYGVTMSEDGISQLLSVKLDQVGEKGEIKEK